MLSKPLTQTHTFSQWTISHAPFRSTEKKKKNKENIPVVQSNCNMQVCFRFLMKSHTHTAHLHNTLQHALIL